MTKEIKPATTYDEQLALLKSRGCFIADDVFCKQKLMEISYYRLSAYFLPFLNPAKDSYQDGTSFEQVYRIYEFDRRLRIILLSALEEIEIFLRSQLSYYHAHEYGPCGYTNAANFSEKHNHVRFRERIEAEIESNKQAPFVKHHLTTYGGAFPIWVASELFTFGMLSYFYGDMIISDQKLIAKELYNTTPKNITSWLRCCTDLRNICAHYGRLYYRIFPAVPAGLEIPDAAARRLWGAVLSVRELYPSREKWNNTVLPAIEALVEEYCGSINLYHIAFPIDWAEKLKKTNK